MTGSVKFMGKTPSNPALDLSEEPQCAAKYKTTPRDPIVVVNPNGALANVFVYVKQGLLADATYPPPTTAAAIDQSGCEYHPQAFGIMVGKPLDIKNSDPLMHNIKTHPKQNRPFNGSQPTAGMTLTRTFTDPEVMLPFECNVHGWMHAYAGMLSHPFHAVTGTPDGRFSITGLPRETYTIEAWHENIRHANRYGDGPEERDEDVDLTYTAQ